MPLKQYIKGNSIALNMYINKEESSYDNNLSFPLRNQKKRMNESKVKRKEIIKITMESNGEKNDREKIIKLKLVLGDQ